MSPVDLDALGAPLTDADLAALGERLPASALDLIRCIGAASALALLNAWPGVVVNVPKSANANLRGALRWQQISAIVGEPAMWQLARMYGGTHIEIATCEALRTERRRRWIRARFDTITAGQDGLSKADAMHRLGIFLARAGQPMSSRAIEAVLDSADARGEARPEPERADPRQAWLFTPAADGE